MLILASTSPRRQELLQLITRDFRVVSSNADEHLPDGMDPQKSVEELALRKAKAVAAIYPGDTVIGADTVVALGDVLLGKPHGAWEAEEMLRALSGAQHSVYTGVAVLSPLGGQVFSERTNVRFTPLSGEQIQAYIATGEPFDKAGAYGIQGKGALFISGIEGDYYNVMGLPVCRLNTILSKFGIDGRNL